MIRLISLIFPMLLLAGCMSQPPAPTVDGTVRHAQPVGPGYYVVKHGDTLYRIAVEHGVDYKDLAAWNNLADPASISDGLVLRVAPPVVAGGSAEVVASPIASDGGVEARPLGMPTAVPAASPASRREAKAGKEPYSDEAYARLNKQPEAAAKADTPAAPVASAQPPASAPAPAPAVGADDVPWQWPSPAKVTAPFSDSTNKGLDFAGKAGDPVLAAGDGKVVYAGSGLRGYGELVIVKHNGTFLSAYAHNRKILVKEGQSVSRGQKIAEMGKTDTDSVKLHFEIRKQGKPVDPAQYLPKR